MSPFTRYGFAALIALFGVYQLNNARVVTAVIAFVVALALVMVGRRL